MDFGVTGKLGEYDLAEQYRKNAAADKNGGVSFAELAAVKAAWQRYDFPHEKFFSDKVDESVLDWKPSGADSNLTDASVQSRIDSTLGKKAIVVPPALEEKMKNDPALAQQVMAKVESFIMKDQATLPSGRIYSCVIVLDGNGEIAHAAGRRQGHTVGSDHIEGGILSCV